MLKIICGEDSIASRNYYLNEIKKYKDTGYVVKNIHPKEIKDVFTGVTIQTLFGQTLLYSTENLNKFINKRKSADLIILDKLSSDKYVVFIDWENETSKRDLKYITNTKIIEFKPTGNIFKLLDSCYPSNLRNFLSIFNEISDKTNEYFILIMLIRHLKKLLLYKINQNVENLAYWQLKKLELQCKYWTKDSLVSFYDKLMSVEVMEKVGKNTYSIKDYIEVLSVYYIK